MESVGHESSYDLSDTKVHNLIRRYSSEGIGKRSSNRTSRVGKGSGGSKPVCSTNISGYGHGHLLFRGEQDDQYQSEGSQYLAYKKMGSRS